MKRDFQAFKNRTAVTKEERLRQRKNCAAIVKDKAARLRGANDNFLITIPLFSSFVPLVTVLFVAKGADRAILKDAPIIILDEATSSVDPENQHALLTAINELTCGKTLIIIAHRLSTIKDADQIIVLDNGHVVQQGTHETLLQQDGIYRRFVKIRQTASSWKI